MKTPKEQLALAISITSKAFENVLDKGGEPYILHCLEVRRNVMRWDDTELEVAAILHDIVEDTDEDSDINWTLNSLRRKGFSERVIKIVDSLTRRFDEGETYEQFISRILNDSDSIKCKMGDIEHNSLILRLKGIRQKDSERIIKYNKSYWLLKSHL